MGAKREVTSDLRVTSMTSEIARLRAVDLGDHGGTFQRRVRRELLNLITWDKTNARIVQFIS